MKPGSLRAIALTIFAIVAILGLLYFDEIKGKLFPKPNVEENNEPALTPEQRQVHVEFIHEIFKAVLNRDVQDGEEFSRYLNILEQGGHYEGIYNGLVYSKEYREKEVGSPPVGAIQIFSKLMTQLVLDQKYDNLWIQEQKKIQAQEGNTVASIMTSSPSKEKAELQKRFENEGLRESPFSLKKKIGEEVLKTIELKKEYKDKLASWYGKFAVFTNSYKVGFGITSRNNAEEYYHYKWALDADLDRIKWESLNRVHRLINAQGE